MPSITWTRLLPVCLLVGAAACADSGTEPPTAIAESTIAASKSSNATVAGPGDAIAARMDVMNIQLEANGAPYRVAVAEYITQLGSGDEGGTVYAKNVGNKQLAHDFVAGDLRRVWSGNGGTSITYAIDQTDAIPFSAIVNPAGWPMTAAQSNAAIITAMNTWDGVQCSNLGLTQNPDFGLNLGIVAGSSPFVVADIHHAGFNAINFAGGVLAATFTFIFTEAGVPTDIDGNGKNDVALREIYYDPTWIWTVGAFAGVDLESIAVHEAGHGLSQAHFGKVWLTNNGDLKASPRAVMNALYAGEYRSLAGTDNGGHCSNWANWPN